MKRSLQISTALLALLFIAVPIAAAEAAPEALSAPSEAAAAAGTPSDTMARIKKAHSEMKNNEGQALEAPQLIPESGPVMQNAMLFIALLMIGFSIFKRFSGSSGKAAGGEAIEILSRKALSSRASLMIIQVGSQSLLLSQTNEDVRFLTELKSQDDFGQTIAGVSLVEQKSPVDVKEMRSALQ